MEPRNLIHSMDREQICSILESVSFKGTKVQFIINNETIRGKPASDPRILEDLRSVVHRANELEIKDNQIQKIQGICGNLLIPPSKKGKTVPNNQFEIDLEKGKAGKFLPAYNRLALFICLRQNSKLFSDVDDMVTKSSPFAAALLNIANEESIPLNREEMAVLYNEFIDAIDNLLKEANKPCTIETLDIIWSVNYGPNDELADILQVAFTKIQMAREKVGGPPLALGGGLGIKCSYTVVNGCAMFDSHVIGHDGELLKEDPWKTFYRTDNPDDEKLAKELCPVIPNEMKICFENRKIVRTMGYTFSEHVLELCYAENWGLVRYLIEQEKGHISEDTGFKVLSSAVHHQNWDTCKELFMGGLPIYGNSKFVDFNSPFFIMVERCNTFHLNSILKVVKIPKCNPKKFKHITKSMCKRYMKKDTEYGEKDVFHLLKELWITSQHPLSESIPSNLRIASILEFYKAIVFHLDKYQEKFKDIKLEQMLRNFISKHEI